MDVSTDSYRPNMISYRGHGMTERTSASNATAHVMAHERRHLQEFRNIANASDMEVVSENISVRYEFVDGKLIPVKGEATAVLRDKQETDQAVPVAQPEADPESSAGIEGETEVRNLKSRLASMKKAVEKQLDDAYSELDSLSDAKGTGDVQLTSLKARIAQFEEKLRKIDRLKSEIDSTQLGELQKAVLGSMGRAGESTENIIGAILGLKSAGYGDAIESNSGVAAGNESNSDMKVDRVRLAIGSLLSVVA